MGCHWEREPKWWWKRQHSLFNRIVSQEIGDSPSKTLGHFVLKTRVKKFFAQHKSTRCSEFDSNEGSKEEQVLSFQDRWFLEIMSSNLCHREDNHSELPLPLKDQTLEMPNNKEMALNHLGKLKQRLKRDRHYREHYQAFMRETIMKRSQAERVPINELFLNNGRVWYIPHHGVYPPQKPDKIRVVFDASTQYKGKSLNSCLLPGSDLTINLAGVLCRFRKEPIALMCDVEGMFHQDGVKEEHQNLLWFLWWEDNDLDKPASQFRMKVHLFGAVSSPGCVNFTLKRTAEDFEKTFGS